MITSKRNYGGTEEKFFNELLNEGLTLCFINNNRSFFKECYDNFYTPKDAIKTYQEVNKIYTK